METIAANEEGVSTGMVDAPELETVNTDSVFDDEVIFKPAGRVELLSDAHGVYGVGVTQPSVYGGRVPDSLIVRPDKVHAVSSMCALQPVPKPGFCHSAEGKLVDYLHRAMCARHGQIDKSCGTWKSWAEQPDPKLAREVYHGTKRLSLRIVNSLIRRALEVADQEALKAARRFPIRYRANLYAAFCQYGERAIQLSESFPLLATMLFCDHWNVASDIEPDTLADYERQQRKSANIRQEHIELVLRGEKLKHISDSLGLPYVYRRITPRGTNYISRTKLPSESLRYLPAGTRQQRVFFYAIGTSRHRFSLAAPPDFVSWIAKHAASMQPREVSELDDIADWVVACSDNEIDEAIRSLPSHLQYRLQQRTGQPRHGGSELVTRRFSANMSLKTVRRISHEWHEAVANHMPEGSLVQFPEPWIDGADLGNYKIVPIRDSRELYLAAKTLHNCATTYGDVICYGQDYLYTVRDEGGKTIVMIELGRDATGASLRQVKAYCNAPAPKEIERLVMRWFNHNKAAVRFPPAPEPRTNRSLPWDEEGVPF